MENVYNEFKRNGISIPYSQLEVRRAAARARGEGSRRGQAHRPRKREFFRSVRIGQKEKSQNQKRQENEVKRQTNRKCAERR